jgi:signal transduction histidine kinase
LQNLVANALKFHAPDRPPRVEIRAFLQESDPGKPDLGLSGSSRWQITVSDEGIGFDPAYAEKIFRPFQRLHGRNEYEGSGMGLAICRKIAQRHGADILVHSEPGKGSTFTVSLSAMPERKDLCPEPQFASSSPRTTTMITC